MHTHTHTENQIVFLENNVSIQNIVFKNRNYETYLIIIIKNKTTVVSKSKE